MFQWFDTRAVKAFANALADQIIARHQENRKPKKKRPETRDDVILREIATRMSDLKKSERLNIYKTAQLANVFKWRLKEAGLDDAYVESLLTVLLTRARQA